MTAPTRRDFLAAAAAPLLAPDLAAQTEPRPERPTEPARPGHRSGAAEPPAGGHPGQADPQ